jgi:hypothetical protein
MIIDMINHAGRQYPGKPRILVPDIEGHRNSKGGWDDSMYVLQHDIIAELLTPWLTEVQTPLIHYRANPDQRRSDDDLPFKLERDGEYVALVHDDA